MTSNELIETQHRIENEWQAKFCGTACIKVSSLSFQEQGSLEQDQHDLFMRYANHAKAIISQKILEDSASVSQISVQSLKATTRPYRQLEIPHGIRLECLQGCDQKEIIEKAANEGYELWPVDLFLSGQYKAF
jgi:hypothetical protein